MTVPPSNPRGPIGRAGLRRFIGDDRGNVAMIFAFALPILIGVAGAGVDMGRASAIRSSLQQSVDATSMTLTDKVKLCHDRERTNGITTDTGCLNNAAYRSAIETEAQALIQTNFKQLGYNQAPILTKAVEMDQITGRLAIEARSGYSCVFMKLINSGCDVVVYSGAASKMSTQANPLVFGGLGAAVELWAKEPLSPVIALSGSGGWTPYAFAVGAGMPAGLSLTQTSDTAAQIAGTPLDQTCTDPSCPPKTLATTRLSVTDSGDQNRSGMNRQYVESTVQFRLYHELKLSVASSSMNTLVKPPAGSYYANVSATGGSRSYQFSCSGLPAGMTCNTTTGSVTGNPNPNQVGTLRITVTDVGRAAKGLSAWTKYVDIPYNFTARAMTFNLGRTNLASDDDTTNTVTANADGGWGIVNVSCGGLPAGYVHNNAPAQEQNYGTVAGKYSGSNNTSGTMTCTASDGSGQVISRTMTWTMTAGQDVECLNDKNLTCNGGMWQASFTNCINGDGRWACTQKWTLVDKDPRYPSPPPPGPDMEVPAHDSVCATDGGPWSAPIYGCQGAFFGCAIKKTWSRSSWNMRCYPRNYSPTVFQSGPFG